MKFNEHFFKQSLPDAKFEFIGNHHESLNSFLNKNEIKQFCVDSRHVKTNSVFIALRGQKVDGHNFIEKALQKGAAIIIAEKKKVNRIKNISAEILNNKLFIFVDDCFKTLIKLAKNWRSNFDYPVIGITGSIGKTSTKKMLEDIFEVAGVPAYVSIKNQNTNIGLSINILNMRVDHKVAVFELGISRVGEMEELADILQPTIGLITKISHSHTLNLGKLADIARQKKIIFKFFKSDNIGIVCGDDALLGKLHYSHPIVRFGLKIKNHIQARKIEIKNNKTTFILKLYREKIPVVMNTCNIGFVNNALAATAVSYLLNIATSDIIKGIENFKGFDNRFEEKTIVNNRGVFISDCYNANPESMKAAILALGKISNNGPKIAVLGDMLELGIGEKFWHRQMGRALGKSDGLNFVILVGNNAKLIAKTAPVNLKIYFARDWRQAKEKLSAIFEINKNQRHLVLVKASRGIMLDKMVDKLSCL